jgi:hypothetical protein
VAHSVFLQKSGRGKEGDMGRVRLIFGKKTKFHFNSVLAKFCSTCSDFDLKKKNAAEMKKNTSSVPKKTNIGTC